MHVWKGRILSSSETHPLNGKLNLVLFPHGLVHCIHHESFRICTRVAPSQLITWYVRSQIANMCPPPSASLISSGKGNLVPFYWSNKTKILQLEMSNWATLYDDGAKARYKHLGKFVLLFLPQHLNRVVPRLGRITIVVSQRANCYNFYIETRHCSSLFIFEQPGTKIWRRPVAKTMYRGAFFAWRAPILSWPRIMCSQVRMLKFLEPSREMP